MLLTVRHTTRYRYQAPLAHTIQQLRLTPPDVPGQKVLKWSLELPGRETAASYTDAFGNIVHLVSHTNPMSEIDITATGEVETQDVAGVLGEIPCPSPSAVFTRFTPLTKPSDTIRRLVSRFDGEPDVTAFHELMQLIREKVRYKPGVTHVHTTGADALKNGEGVCQDHAHIFISAARCIGVPARYVSGYMLLGDKEEDDAHHAWAEVLLKGLGWVGFDVSNGVSPTERYIRLSTGLDSRSAAPIRGVQFGGVAENMSVEVSVNEALRQIQQ